MVVYIKQQTDECKKQCIDAERQAAEFRKDALVPDIRF